MEWVETTAKTVEDAKSAALDQLGVAADEAEFDVLEEPKAGLFGRTRGEARVRARVQPAQVRPKNERRRKSSKDRSSSRSSGGSTSKATTDAPDASDTSPDSGAAASTDVTTEPDTDQVSDSQAPARSGGRQRTKSGSQGRNDRSRNNKQESKMNDDNESPVSPQEVGEAAVAFMDGLVAAFGSEGSTELTIDDTELDVMVNGEGLGLLVGPGGRTLNAIQDLARVSAQRRLGDHETRLRIDVAGYRVRRSEALARFAADVASQVRESGTARSLEPMSSADRKVIHDALNDEEGVSSRSEGDDPNRRVVVDPD